MKKLALISLLLVGNQTTFAAAPEVVAIEDAVTPIGTITRIGFPVAVVPRQILFQAVVDPGPQPSFSAVLRHKPPGLMAVAAAGQVLAGGVLDIENLFNAGSTIPSLNPSGDVIFVAEVGPVGSTNFDEGLVRFDGDTGALSAVVRDGDPAPDGHGFLNVSLLNRPAINASGQVGFFAEIFGATGGLGNGDGLFRGGLGTVTQIARTAQALPGGGTIDGVTWPSMNDAGQVAFYATITGAGAGAAGMFRGDGSSITKIARTGDQPVAGWVIRSFNPLEGVPINNSGWVAFRAQIDATAPFDTVFRGNGTSTVLIGFAGQPIPGSTGTLRTIDRNVAINDAGQVAFIASITDSSVESGIFRGDGTTLKKIAREGDLVPGTAAGFFTDFQGFPFAINALGEIAFIARFQFGCCLQNGLFYYSDRGGLVRVVTEGDSLAGGIVDDFDFTGTHPFELRSKASGLDDAGRVAFRFDLTSGPRGVAVFDGHAVFQDGFESGNTSGWSATVP